MLISSSLFQEQSEYGLKTQFVCLLKSHLCASWLIVYEQEPILHGIAKKPLSREDKVSDSAYCEKHCIFTSSFGKNLLTSNRTEITSLDPILIHSYHVRLVRLSFVLTTTEKTSENLNLYFVLESQQLVLIPYQISTGTTIARIDSVRILVRMVFGMDCQKMPFPNLSRKNTLKTSFSIFRLFQQKMTAAAAAAISLRNPAFGDSPSSTFSSMFYSVLEQKKRK